MNDRRKPFGDIKNSCRVSSQLYPSLHQKYPKLKKMPTQKDYAYNHKHGMTTFGLKTEQSILSQTLSHHSYAPCQNPNRASPYPDLTNRPASPYRRTEEVKAQLSQILRRPEKTLSRTTSEKLSIIRMDSNDTYPRRDMSKSSQTSHDSNIARPSSCGPSLRDRLEQNKECMKLLVQNSPFSKSRSHSADSGLGRGGSFQHGERSESGDRTVGRHLDNKIPPSYGTSQYIYKLFTANDKAKSLHHFEQRSRSPCSRSGVFNAGLSLPVKHFDRKCESDSAVDSDSLQSTEAATDGDIDDEVLLRMLCRDLGAGTRSTGQNTQYYKDCDIDSGITNITTDNQESSSSIDSDIFNRAMCQPTRPSSVPVGSDCLRPSSRHPFKVIRTGPMKADHNLQPITSLGCMSSKQNDLDTEVEYWNGRDQTSYTEKENLYKPCVKKSTTRKRNSPTQNLRVRFQDECMESKDGVKKPRSEGQGQEKRSRTSSSDDEYSSESLSSDGSEDYTSGHVTHRAAIAMVSGGEIQKQDCARTLEEQSKIEQSCSVEPMVSSSIMNVHGCSRTIPVEPVRLQESSSDQRCSRWQANSSRTVENDSQGISLNVHKQRVKSASLTRLGSRSEVCATEGADTTRRCPSPMILCSNGATNGDRCRSRELASKRKLTPQFRSQESLSRSGGDQFDVLHSMDDLTGVMSPDRQATSCFSSNLQSTKSLSGSRTSLSEKMDNFKSKAKTKFSAIRRACSLESLDRKSRSGSVEFGQSSGERSTLKKAPSLTSLFKFGSGKKKDRCESKSRNACVDSSTDSSKPSSSDQHVSHPAKSISSPTPDVTLSPTPTCLPVSTKLGRALMMRSQSISDLSAHRVEELRNFRPIGKLVSLNADGSQTVLLNKPPHGPFGFYIARGNAKYKHGIFISRLTDGYPNSFFAGLLGIGDEILEINSVKTRSMSLDDVYDVMASKETLLMKIVPLMTRKDV